MMCRNSSPAILAPNYMCDTHPNQRKQIHSRITEPNQPHGRHSNDECNTRVTLPAQKP